MPATKHENKRTTIDVRDITVAEGQTLRIKTMPNGEVVLAERCPSGQTWTVSMHIEISISD